MEFLHSPPRGLPSRACSRSPTSSGSSSVGWSSGRWPGPTESEHRTSLQEAVEQRTADLIAARNRAAGAVRRARDPLLDGQSRPAHPAARRPVGDRGRGDRSGPGERTWGVRPSTSRSSQHRIQGPGRARRTGAGAEHPRVVDLGRVARTMSWRPRQRPCANGVPSSDVVVVASASIEVLVDVDRFRRIVHTLLAGRLIDQSPGSRANPPGRPATCGRPDRRGAQPRDGGHHPGADPSARRRRQTGEIERRRRCPSERRRIEVRIPVAVQGRHRRGVGRRVLLVDDIDVTRQISAAMLTAHRC